MIHKLARDTWSWHIIIFIYWWFLFTNMLLSGFLYVCFPFLAALQQMKFLSQGIKSKPHLQHKPQLQQCQLPNPLCQARDQTCIPVIPRCWWSHCFTMGTPVEWLLSVFMTILSVLFLSLKLGLILVQIGSQSYNVFPLFLISGRYCRELVSFLSCLVKFTDETLWASWCLCWFL